MTPATASHTTSLEQRNGALKRANEVRVARARLKAELRRGTTRIEAILSSPPEHVATAKVLDLLVAVPKIGPVRAGRLLHTARIGELKTVAGLSDRQRALLIELLRGCSGA